MSQAADFFVSYSSADRAWAEWIAWQLDAEGHAVVVQAWDFRPGRDFVQQMHQAVEEAKRTIAVLSPAYLGSAFGGAEWQAVFAKDPTGEHGLLLPVRVENVEPPRAAQDADLCGPSRPGRQERPNDAAGCGKRGPWQAIARAGLPGMLAPIEKSWNRGPSFQVNRGISHRRSLRRPSTSVT